MGTSGDSISLETARRRLRQFRHRRDDGFALAPLLLADAALSLLLLGDRGLAVTALAGAVAALAVGLISRWQRLELLTRMVAQGDERRLPAAGRHARRLISPRQRLLLAEGVDRAATGQSLSLGRPARRLKPELRAIAQELRNLDHPVAPRGVALVVRLLELGVDAPPRDEQRVERELRRALDEIQAGLRAA